MITLRLYVGWLKPVILRRGEIMVGTVLSGRYEILEKVGEGGMSVVYKARDRVLNRIVAVKILREQLTGDENFIRAFHREAQAAASLSHPNIVSIYDVGQDADKHFIVMELIEGKHLKDIIRQEAPFPIKQSLIITRQICDALSHAHQKNIIHCDIKPHNILINEDGRVKVADFGIARAVNSVTMNLSDGIMGSVLYFSPEQAQQETLNRTSDIYSLGIVLYEMLMGNVPFSGENPIAIALKHVREDIPITDEMANRWPKELINILHRALEKNPDDRYQSAQQMARDVSTCLDKIARNPKWDDEANQTAVFAGLNPNETEEEELALRRHRREKSVKKTGSRKHKIGIAAILLIAMSLGIFIGLWKFAPAQSVEMPKLIGETVKDAQGTLEDIGLEVNDIKEKEDQDFPPGVIVDQEPSEGTKIGKGKGVTLFVNKSDGGLVQVPSVVGKTLEDAERLLEEAGFQIGNETNAYSEDIPEDEVMAQNPRGRTQVGYGEKIDLVISMGKEIETVVVPDFTDQTVEQAKQRLASLNLELGKVEEQENDHVNSGLIFKQRPGKEMIVEAGSTVDFVVSADREQEQENRVRTYTVKYKLPESAVESKVDIILKDLRGTRTVYTGSHSPGDVLEETIKWEGQQALVQVLVNGSVVAEEIITP